MTRRDVAFVVRSFAGGGIESSTIRLANELACQGVAVDLAVSRADGPLSCTVAPAVRIIDLHKKTLRGSLPAIVRYLLREQPKSVCVLGSSLGCLLAATARTAGLETRVGVWATSTHADREARRAAHRPGTRARLQRRLARLVFTPARLFRRMPTGIVAVSQFIGQECSQTRKWPPDRVHIIYNALIDRQLLDRIDTWNDDTGHYDRPFIISMGRLEIQKDFGTLLKAFGVVRDRYDIDLIVLGEGERTVARLGLSGFVELPGFEPDPFPLLGRAKLFVLSSQWEPFGNVLVEAMACGCPVVSTDCTGPREILQNGRYGRLVPIGNHEALADAILEAIENPPDRRLLRERAMECDAGRIARRYRELLEI